MTAAGLHKREHNSVLASIEKRLLVRIARALPPWLSPDHLTMLGLGSMVAAGACFAALRVNPGAAAAGAIAALALNWFGDSLDGTLARTRGHERPRYGFYVDHVIDLAGVAALCAGMGCSGRMTPLIATALAAAYFLVAAESYLATHSAGTFRISFAGFGPTELRIVLAVGAIFIVRHPVVTIASRSMWLFDVGGIVAAAGLAATVVISAARNTRHLYIAEPVPRAFSGADRLHGDAGRLETGAKPGREMIRAWRVAVNADRVGLERHE
jgi:archaetidylinositol phosphate synthase